MIIGAHINKESTIIKTIQKIIQYNGNALQFFTTNPRSGNSASIPKDANTIFEFIKNNSFSLVIHSAYTINIATPIQTNIKDVYWYKAILQDLNIAHQIGAIGAIIHVGKYTKQTPSEGLKNMKEAVENILKDINKNKYNSLLLLETAAGQGTELCVDIDEFIEFYNNISDKSNLGICFDTCHVWVAGFDIVKAFKKIQKQTNNSIRVIHLNGSLVPMGSKKDRHSPILKNSTIPQELLEEFLKELKKYPNIIIILETPDDDVMSDIQFCLTKMI